MIVPQFMRFYHYSLADTLDEFAVAFFSLVNSMYRIRARENLDGALQVSLGMSGKEGRETLNKLEKESQGLHGILKEVRNVKG